MKKYYTLAVRENGKWSPEFGSYDKSDVISELQDYRDKGTKASNLQVVISGDKREDVEKRIAELNS